MKTYRMFALVKADESEETEGREVRVIASTESVDRMGDIVEQSWNLENFKANPVILWGHDANTPPIGRATSIAVEKTGSGPQLIAAIKFDEGPHNPLANTVAEQFRNGTLNAVSVGFRPSEVTPRSTLADNDERRSEQGLILSKNELLEISAVSIPANSQALALRSITEVAEIEAQEIDSTEDMIAAAVKESLADLPALVLDAVRNDPEIRAAIVGHVLAMPVDEPVSLAEMLKGLEQEPISLADYLKA